MIDEGVLSGILQRNLKHRKFRDSVVGKLPKNLTNLLDRTEKYIRVEETIGIPQNKRKRYEAKHDAPKEVDRRVSTSRPSMSFTPLNTHLSDVLVISERDGLLGMPPGLG